MLSTSPNLIILSKADIFPLSTKTFDCTSGSDTTFNNNSSLVIAEHTMVSLVNPDCSTKNIVVPSA